MVLTFSMGIKNWFGFGGVWWTAPLAGDVPRIRSPACPLLRLFGRRRAFLSRNSTSSRSTALLSGKLIFKLLPPTVWCKLAAMAGGVSTRKKQTNTFSVKTLEVFFFYSISFCRFKFFAEIFFFNIFVELLRQNSMLSNFLLNYDSLPFKISCSKFAVGTTITKTTPGIFACFFHLQLKTNWKQTNNWIYVSLMLHNVQVFKLPSFPWNKINILKLKINIYSP